MKEGINRLRSAIAIFAVSKPAGPRARGRKMGAETFVGAKPLIVDLLTKWLARRVASPRGMPRRIKSLVFIKGNRMLEWWSDGVSPSAKSHFSRYLANGLNMRP